MVVICIVLVIISISYGAARRLADAVGGMLPGNLVTWFVLLRTIIGLEDLLPTSLYLSIVLGLGRLYRDSEITALFACGISPTRIFRAVLCVSLPVATLVAILSLYVRPLAYQKMYSLRAIAEAQFDVGALEAGTFYQIEQGKLVVFADQIDQERHAARRIFIRNVREGDLQVMCANKAYHHEDEKTGKRVLVFLDGYLYEFSQKKQRDSVTKFEQSIFPVEPENIGVLKHRVKAAPTSRLRGSSSLAEVAEFQWRLSTPLSTILLALLAVPLSRTSPRRGKYAKLVGTVLIFAVYYNLVAMAMNWVEDGVVDPVPGIWWVQALLVGVLVLLLKKSDLGLQWRRR